jgi:N-acetylmuramoyl-L-alanine amidase
MLSNFKLRGQKVFANLLKTTVFLMSLIFLLGFSSCLAQTADYSMNKVDDIKAIQKKYTDGKIKILIVPGHDKEYFGTQFKNVEEEYFNLQLAEKIYNYFKSDNKFDVSIVRDSNGYLSVFVNYFKDNREKITKFIANTKDYFSKNFLNFENITGVIHNDAENEVAIRLFGINMWADENFVDLIIHVHFNDYAGRKKNSTGEYSGFTIYIPEKQFPNYSVSSELAKPVFKNLSQVMGISSLPQESAGIVEDQNLIAIGPRFSLSAAAMLIEYGYIYDIYNITPVIRKELFKELAFLTYSGVSGYFDPAKISKLNSVILPYKWKNSLSGNLKKNKDVLALQIALVKEGVYPPTGFSLDSCPINGNFLKCTKLAVIQFQEKYFNDILKPANKSFGTGYVGALTLKKLNNLYSN